MQEITKPIIIESETSNLDGRSGQKDNPRSPKTKSKLVSLIPKMLFFILGAILVYELVLGVRTLMQPIPKTSEITDIGGGKITLVTQSKDYKPGDEVPVTVGFSTGNFMTSGMDIVLRYNPKVLEIKEENFVKGTIFQEYPLFSIDNKNGIVYISGIMSPGKSVRATGVFAQLKFKAISAGKAVFSLDYKPGRTDDSNIIFAKSTKDILKKVNTVQVNVI